MIYCRFVFFIFFFNFCPYSQLHFPQVYVSCELLSFEISLMNFEHGLPSTISYSYPFIENSRSRSRFDSIAIFLISDDIYVKKAPSPLPPLRHNKKRRRFIETADNRRKEKKIKIVFDIINNISIFFIAFKRVWWGRERKWVEVYYKYGWYVNSNQTYALCLC